MRRSTSLILLLLLSTFAIGTLFVEPAMAAATKLLTPRLSVEIPGLTFTKGIIDGETLRINYLADYIAAMYKWMLGAAVILAIIMIMIGGLQWTMSGGSILGTGGKANSSSAAKTRISNAVTGLVLLLSTYMILNIVNPNLVKLQFPALENVELVTIPDDGEDVNVDPNATPAPDGTEYISHRYINANSQTANSEILESLYAAAEDFFVEASDMIYVAGGSRSPQRQLEIFFDKCSVTKDSAECNPLVCLNHDYYTTKKFTRKGGGKWDLDGSVDVSSKSAFVNDLIGDAKASLCPHTSTVALDLWCTNGRYGDYTFDPQCQKTLGDVMLRNGFCRLAGEAWHFEYNKYKVSSACTTSQNTCEYTGNATYNFCEDKNAAGESCVKFQGKKAGKCISYK